MKTLLITATSKARAIELLNKYFYSTTYGINEQDQVTWKDGEVKTNLFYTVKKNRHQIREF